MSRSTQYIGLTDRAEQFLAKYNAVQIDDPENYTKGMFGEIVPFRTWEVVTDLWDKGEKITIREVLQADPWSSGPMLFTCLQIDWGNGVTFECFQWIDDPMLIAEHKEMDREQGAFWV